MEWGKSVSKYFEEFKVGERYRTHGKTISEGAVAIMVGLGGLSSPIFNDEEYAKSTPFGTRLVPGRLTLFFMGGLEEQLGLFDETVIALIGIDKLRLKAPVKPGDTIHVELEIIEMKEISKADRGIVVHRSRCLNQRGEVVLVTEITHMMRRKPG